MKVLHLISTINDNGGVQKVLYNYISNSSFASDRYSIIVHGNKQSMLAKKMEALGCNIMSILPRKEAGIAYYKNLKSILNNTDYDILHIHLGYKSAIPLYISKIVHPSSKVIVHIHSNMKKISFAKKIQKFLGVLYIKWKADAFFSCGKDAAIWFYGRRIYEKNSVFIMRNAIPTIKFSFSEQKRKEVRNSYGIDENKMVLGHVGTFYEPKNQLFLIEIFNEYHKLNNDSILMLVGGGKLEKKLKDKVIDLGLVDLVVFVGVKEDTSSFYSAFDFFLLPSIYEGVPMSLIEAQSSGLISFVSSNVTKETDILGYNQYFSIDLPAKQWAKKISETIPLSDRRSICSVMQRSEFDINTATKALHLRYDKLLNKKGEIC